MPAAAVPPSEPQLITARAVGLRRASGNGCVPGVPHPREKLWKTPGAEPEVSAKANPPMNR